MAPNGVESVEISQTASPFFYFVPQCYFYLIIMHYHLKVNDYLKFGLSGMAGANFVQRRPRT